MKNQALFSSKDKSKKIKMSFAAVLVWRLKVNPRCPYEIPLDSGLQIRGVLRIIQR